MLVTDTATIGAPRFTANGYMVVDAAVARVGIQTYSGREVGMPQMDAVRLYRPEAQVFHGDALGSFTHKPVTDNHPTEMVTASNWKAHAVGMTGDSVVRDGDHVRVPFTVMDGATIALVQSGKRELSCGYVCDLDWTPGTTPSGEAYDAVQTNIRGNHLAIVDRGRAGSTCRIGDSWIATPPTMKDRTMPENLRSVLLDGLTIQTTDQGAQAIEKLQAALADAASKLTGRDGQIAALTSTHERAIGTKDGEIATLKTDHAKALEAKDGEIAALTAKIGDTASVDAMIAAREATIAGARRILGDSFDPKGKTDGDIRRAAVVKRLGDALVAGKSDDYVAAAFDTLTVTVAPRDPMRDALRHGPTPVPMNDRETAHAEYVRNLQDGWKPGAKGAA